MSKTYSSYIEGVRDLLSNSMNVKNVLTLEEFCKQEKEKLIKEIKTMQWGYNADLIESLHDDGKILKGDELRGNEIIKGMILSNGLIEEDNVLYSVDRFYIIDGFKDSRYIPI